MNVSHLASLKAGLKCAGVCCDVEQFVLPVLHTVLCECLLYSQGCLLWAGLLLQSLKSCILLESIVAMPGRVL